MHEVHATHVRVRYGETDQGGVVYHGNYLHYFEVGRTELLRGLGHPYAEIERGGHVFPVVEANVRYRAPARYDDLLRVETRISEVRRVRMQIDTRVLRDEDGQVLAEGYLWLACIDHNGRLRPIPDGVRDAIREASKPSNSRKDAPSTSS